MKNVRLTKVAGALVLALGVSASAFAADTSSAMRGKITSPTGDAAANVKVTVIHEPTGTVSTFVTNDSGAFVAKGLRVGGPYRVILDSDEYTDTQLDNIYLDLGETHRITSQLKPLQIEKISVTGYKIVQEAGGSSSTFGADTIANTPSFNNDIKDIARLNPLASVNGNGDMTIAGNNPRTNSLTVDGIGQNDDFGVNFGGYPTEQPPIALDAIEQISIDASPFSARKGNFGGGTINAVTKSGSNDFTFTGFYEVTNPSLAGKVDSISQVFADGKPVLDEDGHRTFEVTSTDPIQSEHRFGISTGGAIIEDELFFFVNYNSWASELEMDYGFEGSGATHEYDTTEANFNRFLDILESEYSLTDSLGGDPEDTNDSLLVKLSWNINDSHRTDFTYQWQDDSAEKNFGTGGNTVMLASARYKYETSFNNFAVKLYSDWTDNLSTEIGISYKDVESDSITNSNIGSVKVEERFRGPAYQFGTDEFRHNNKAATENLTFTFDGTYFFDEHEINFGAQLENLRLYNLFAANSLGSWEFDNFEGFKNREVGNFKGTYDFSYRNAYTNNSADTAYDASRNQLALYIEDTFYVMDDLQVTAGVRYERLSSSDKATLNQNFLDTYGFTNQENLDGLDIILPRIGFKYYATDALTIKGGIGRFQGGIPNVWYNNPYQNDGLTYVAASEDAINAYYAENKADITKVPQEIQDSLQPGAGSTNYTDPNFKLPSSIRAQVGFDYEFDAGALGDGFKWTAELAYHKKENEAVWHNTALIPNGESADGRIIYKNRYEGELRNNFDIMMTNADVDGRSVIFSTALAKEWDNGLYASVSYAHQDVTEVAPGSSSRAQSNYKYTIMESRNVDMAERGYYEVEHSFKVNLRYSKQFFEGYNSEFNVFFERRSGRPFSYTMGMYKTDDFGDTIDFYKNSSYLAYIPTGADDATIDWAASEKLGMSWDKLETLLNRGGISERGTIIGRNTGTQPWVTTMDVSFKQEIPGFAKGHKGQFYVMIENFANLLNSDWGIEKRMGHSDQAIYDFHDLNEKNQLVIKPRHDGADVRNYNQYQTSSSAWQAKIGIRYTF
ncbi:TonB-dependent receptor (plasmid) [Pseudoalteromonas sp. T1lg65]|uniref:TonB-dependent receptor n=1 Tax=Pseudoalteromonas sp. T1lg65 TaxID=2077101 RepID=UPI003F796CB3